MKRILHKFVVGFATLLWVIGLAMSLRTESGLWLIALLSMYAGAKFGVPLLNGTLRAALAEIFPNKWVRRYVLLFGYTIFAFPGLLIVAGQWTVTDWRLRYPNVENSTPDFTPNAWWLSLFVAVVVPAICLVMWSELDRSRSTPQKSAN